MKPRLKPIRDQVIVITGASSGIGLTTANRAADRGASVVLAARNENALRRAVEAIRQRRGRAVYVVADVADPAQVAAIGDTASGEFGRIDTWVNNAGTSIYGRLTEMSIEDLRRLFEVNYWGEVYGSRVAVEHLRRRGGALINVSSCLADRAIPLQGNYCASKHAVKAFTDALRMELEEEGLPISVTQIKPASINTPFYDKAKSYTGFEQRPVVPVYAPEIVADAILAAAESPVRDVIAGGSARMLAVSNLTPRLTDRVMERTMFRSQQTHRPTNGRPDNLHAPLPADGGRRGKNWAGRTRESSLYTNSTLHRWSAAAALLAITSAVAGVVAVRQQRTKPFHSATWRED